MYSVEVDEEEEVGRKKMGRLPFTIVARATTRAGTATPSAD